MSQSPKGDAISADKRSVAFEKAARTETDEEDVLEALGSQVSKVSITFLVFIETGVIVVAIGIDFDGNGTDKRVGRLNVANLDNKIDASCGNIISLAFLTIGREIRGIGGRSGEGRGRDVDLVTDAEDEMGKGEFEGFLEELMYERSEISAVGFVGDEEKRSTSAADIIDHGFLVTDDATYDTISLVARMNDEEVVRGALIAASEFDNVGAEHRDDRGRCRIKNLQDMRQIYPG